jgi:hypothetical protein
MNQTMICQSTHKYTRQPNFRQGQFLQKEQKNPDVHRKTGEQVKPQPMKAKKLRIDVALGSVTIMPAIADRIK